MRIDAWRTRYLLGAVLVAMSSVPAVQGADRNTELNNELKASCPGYMAWSSQERADEAKNKNAAPPPTKGTDEKLTADLIRMQTEDQQARNAGIKAGVVGGGKSDPIVFNHVLVVDQRDLKALHQIIAANGVPTKEQVGRAGLSAFWLLVQHADTDVALQMQVLKAFSAADSGVPPGDIAMLTDRVRIHQGQPQLYGSQFHLSGKTMEPDPIEDAPHVDERRKLMKLPPLADYACLLGVMYKATPAK